MVCTEQFDIVLVITADAHTRILEALRTRDPQQCLRHLFQEHALVSRRARLLRGKDAHLTG